MILRPIFPDQLSDTLPSLIDLRPQKDILIMSERGWSFSDRPHHPKKLIYLISAQRHFAQKWREKGFEVLIQAWDTPQPLPDLGAFIQDIVKKRQDIAGVVLTEPSTAQCRQETLTWGESLNLPVGILEDNRFYTTQRDFDTWAAGRKTLRMEFFYRMVRARENILIQENGEPEGGTWNYDPQNREPAKNCPPHNKPYMQPPDLITQEVIDMLKSSLPSSQFGSFDSFYYAVTREAALEALEMFINERLGLFGDFQDVMRDDDPWLYHSHISLYINSGLLLARECVDKVVAAYYDGKAPINAVEGYVRQIVGWREFIRGLYGHYQTLPQPMNALGAQRALPELYWGGETKMRCLQQCVADTERQGYAHHIQRLMVLGNFALLSGINPAEVDRWFLLVYADAYEWVEQPNVLGMSLFADGGLMASKPYIASGAYINKMSNYCKGCHYNVKEKLTDDACPFNTLYWNFLSQHEERFRSNPRMLMPYRTLERLGPKKRAQYEQKAQKFLEELDSGKTV